MTEFIIIAVIFWIPAIIVILRNILWDVYFWQLKEFRWDRFWTHIRWDYDEQNRNPVVTGLKFVLFALTSLVFQVPLLTIAAVIFAFALWSHEMFAVIQSILFKKQKRPSLKNPRNILIIGLLLGFIASVITLLTIPFAAFARETGMINYSELFNSLIVDSSAFAFPDIYIYLAYSTLVGLFFDFSTPLFSMVAVIITAPMAFLRRWITIKQAQAKFNSIKQNLTVIGITGSQGKTTMKEVLYSVLKDNFKVAKTPENYNTDFGVAVSVLKQIKKDTEIFIAEMGAYREGEIKYMAKHFPPNYSVVTDVDVQHLGIFGSHDKLFMAKSEIVRYMNPNGIAVLNGDNERCVKMAQFSSHKTIIVYSENDSEKHLKEIDTTKIVLIKAFKIKNKKDGVMFTITTENGNAVDVNIPHKGNHLINTYLMAFAIAMDLGMKQDLIIEKLQTLNMQMPRLGVETGDNGTTILDDSYNSSFKGFIAAVELMQEYYNEKKEGAERIVITKGIYELGKNKKKIYKELMERIHSKMDVLITSDSLLAKTAQEDNVSLQVKYVKGHEEMIYAVRNFMSPGDIVLLEGRLHPSIIKEIVSDKR